MLVSFSYSSNIFITIKQYLDKIFFLKKYSFSIRFLKFIFLIPAAFMGGTVLRKKLINQHILIYRKLNILNLQVLEEKTKNEFGLFKLNAKEREIYRLKKSS